MNLRYIIILYFTSHIRGYTPLIPSIYSSSPITYPSIYYLFLQFPSNRISHITYSSPKSPQHLLITHFHLNALNTSFPLFQLFSYLLYLPSLKLLMKTPILYTSLFQHCLIPFTLLSPCLLLPSSILSNCPNPCMTLKSSQAPVFLVRFLGYTYCAFYSCYIYSLSPTNPQQATSRA